MLEDRIQSFRFTGVSELEREIKFVGSVCVQSVPSAWLIGHFAPLSLSNPAEGHTDNVSQ